MSVRIIDSKVSAANPIGVFDSGLGGLTVVRELRKQLPNEDIVYFGDIANLPYGIKTSSQLKSLSQRNTSFLLTKKVKAVVVACNSASSVAIKELRSAFSIPVIDVISPVVTEASKKTKKKNIALLATQATVHSRAYATQLRKVNPKIKVHSLACPMFVPLVEAGWLSGPEVEAVIQKSLKSLLKKPVDVVMLGCTHYPLLRNRIKKFVGAKVTIIDSARPTIRELKNVLKDRKLLRRGRGQGRLNVYLSDHPGNFQEISEAFMGEKIHTSQVRLAS